MTTDDVTNRPSSSAYLPVGDHDRHRTERHQEHTCPAADWQLCEEVLLLRSLVAAYESGTPQALYSAKMDLLEWDDRDA